MQVIDIKSPLWILSLLTYACAQTVRSVKGTNGNSCNVVNVHFGDNDEHSDAASVTNAGPPGKRGPIGPSGPEGQMGQKGQKGERAPSVNLSTLKSEILSALGSTTCSELRDSHGVSATGYYWTRDSSSGTGRYIFCDFHVYSDVTTCSELSSQYNVSEYGHYLLGKTTSGFQYCPDVHTCHHLVLRDGIAESGIYQVGSPGDQYEVYCNLFGSSAVTEIWHDSMDEIKATDCEVPDCYSHVPQYSISADKIVKIVNDSKQCRQFIKYRCKGSVLLNNLRERHGYWSSRDGEVMTYWGGAHSKRPGFCACGERGSCFVKNQKCNCDNNGQTMTQDEGYLTDKSKLPVSKMGFGDMGDSTESGWHTLGKLECSGEA